MPGASLMRPFHAFALALLMGCPPIPDEETAKDTGGSGLTDADGDGYDVESDCDDADGDVNPGAAELCNEIDDDCDGTVDVGATDATAWYADADGDGFGDPLAKRTSCSAPRGYVSDGSDCNDASDAYHPGAPETACSGPDFNCNGAFDEGDGDGDGVLACDDCDDTRTEVQPGAPELCDGLDNDCNGDIDDGAGDSTTFYADLDGDLYGDADSPIEACALPPGASETKNDCDDTKAGVHPGADEYCNGDDDDCDDEVDNDPVDPATFYADRDNDGYGNISATTTACSVPAGYTEDATDCNDNSGSVHPGAAEYCGGTDWDCDGASNESSSVDVSAYYTDGDGDGYYGTYAGAACSAPSGASFASTDCDDGDTTINPAADDECNDIDDDCDGLVDDGNRVPEDYASIQSAIYASSNGERVCVAAGTYVEDISFYGRSITVEGEDGSALTTLYGTGTTSVVTISSGEVNPVLRGFTITNGKSDQGAGLYIYNSDAVLDDLVISGNSCTDYYCAGVGANIYYSDVTATDIEISDNYAQPSLGSSTYVYVQGVGLYLASTASTWDGLTIGDNEAYITGLTSSSHYGYIYGVGLHATQNSGAMDNVVVKGNYVYRPSSSYGYVYGYGVGAYLSNQTGTYDGWDVWQNAAYLYGPYDNTIGVGLYDYQDTATWDHLDVRANTADAYQASGVGIHFGYSSTPVITNAVVAANKGTYSTTGVNYVYGAGIQCGQYAVPILTNVDIYGNKGTADYAFGGGIELDYYGGIDATNVSVSGNTAAYSSSGGGGAVYLYYTSYTSGYAFTYSNFYNNSSSEFYNLSSVVGSSGNVAVSPGYTAVTASDSTTWDFTLTATSSMRNAGDPALFDVDGSRSDIGGQGGAGGGW